MAIKDLQVITRERIVECLDYAIQEFMPSCVPIYANLDGGELEAVGSGILLSFKDENYILTAAHIIDQGIHGDLKMAAGKELISLAGDYFRTRPIQKCGGADNYDFAFRKLDREETTNISDAGHSFFKRFSYNQLGTESRIYAAFGFPNTLNRICRYREVVKPTMYPFANVAEETAHHIKVVYDNKGLINSASGDHVNGIRLTGMSGGALIDMGKIMEPENLMGRPSGSLCGMIIEKTKDKKMVAVKIDVILDEIGRQC